jgi:hypothetical protein
MSNNGLNADNDRGMDYLGPAVAASKITSLNIASNFLFKNGGIEAIVSMLDNGAISSVNLLKNAIDTNQAKALVLVLKEHPTLKSLCGNKGDETKLDMSRKMHGVGDAIMLVEEIIDNGALSLLNLSSNCLTRGTLKTRRKTYGGTWGSKDDHYESDMQGVIALANAIPDMGALSSANLLGNSILAEQAQELVKIMRSKENLTTLCGLSREETELDFSGQDLGAGDAVLIANDIRDMGASTSLDLSGNHLCQIVLTDGITYSAAKSGQMLYWKDRKSLGADPPPGCGHIGVISIVDAIRDMGALTSLNLSSNNLEAGSAKIVAEAMKVTNNAIASFWHRFHVHLAAG